MHTFNGNNYATPWHRDRAVEAASLRSEAQICTERGYHKMAAHVNGEAVQAEADADHGLVS